MKLGVEVTLTGRDPFTVAAGPRAISAAEKRYGFRISDGELDIERIAYMAWTQAVSDTVFLGPFDEFWAALDDLNMVPAGSPNPTGPQMGASPDSS